MMTMKRLFRSVFPEPFRPYPIRTRDGRSFVIDEPDTVGVNINYLAIHTLFVDDIPESEGPMLRIPLAEIEAIEPIDLASAAESK